MRAKTEIQKTQIEASQASVPVENTDPEPEVDYTEPESVKAWTQWNTRESDRKIEAGIQKYHTANVLPVQNLALTQAHQTQVSEAKSLHGERFDWNRDKKEIEAVQQANPSLTVVDAFRHIDYSRLQNEMTNGVEKKTELANAATVNSGPSSAAVTKIEATKLIASKEDRDMAKNFGMPIKDWMKSKYEHEKGDDLL